MSEACCIRVFLTLFVARYVIYGMGKREQKPKTCGCWQYCCCCMLCRCCRNKPAEKQGINPPTEVQDATETNSESNLLGGMAQMAANITNLPILKQKRESRMQHSRHESMPLVSPERPLTPVPPVLDGDESPTESPRTKRRNFLARRFKMGGQGSKRTKLTKEDLDFLLSNTNFTKRQIKQWYKGFMRDCPSGQLTRKKFLEVYSGFFPEGNAEKFCEHVFRTFDADNSGKIDFKEFLLAINITSAGKPEEKLEWAFQMYDINGDGTIENKEMVEIITAIYSMVANQVAQNPEDTPEKRTAEIFDKMDENKDGVLSKEEFIKGCMADQFLYQMLTADQSCAES